jgi:hypothetical protein
MGRLSGIRPRLSAARLGDASQTLGQINPRESVEQNNFVTFGKEFCQSVFELA